MNGLQGKCAGIEIGNKDLHIAVREGGNVTRVITQALPEGLVRDGQVLSYEALSDLLKTVRRREKIKAKDAALVLPASLCYCRRFTTAVMTEEQLKFNLPYEFRDYITGDKEDFYFDYALVGAPGADSLDLMAAAAPKQLVWDYAAALRRAGFRLKTAVPDELAFINLARAGGDTAHSHCVLDLGHSAIRLYMMDGDKFENVRALDYGLSALDNAIAEHYNVDVHIAAAYREQDFDNCLTLPECRDIYQAVAVEVLKAVNFQRFNSGGAELQHIHCCGGGVRNGALLGALHAALNLPVLDMSEFWPALPAELAGDASLAAAAVGAAMQ